MDAEECSDDGPDYSERGRGDRAHFTVSRPFHRCDAEAYQGYQTSQDSEQAGCELDPAFAIRCCGLVRHVQHISLSPGNGWGGSRAGGFAFSFCILARIDVARGCSLEEWEFALNANVVSERTW